MEGGKRRREGRRGRLGQCRAPPVELCALRTTGKITTVTSSFSDSDASETSVVSMPSVWCRSEPPSRRQAVTCGNNESPVLVRHSAGLGDLEW